MREQLQAGYVLSTLRDCFLFQEQAPFWQHVLQSLSTFDIEIEGSPSIVPPDDPIFCVADNIISRGCPTIPSCLVERHLAESLGLTEEIHSLGSIRFPLTHTLSSAENTLLQRAFAPVDARIAPDAPRLADEGNGFGSELEERFYYGTLSRVAGSFAPQVVALQRPLASIIDAGPGAFERQAVDFAVEFPRVDGEWPGLVIEIDGQHHHKEGQRRLDQRRDEICRQAGWAPTLRLAPSEIDTPPPDKAQRLQDFFRHPYARALAHNYSDPLWTTDEGMKWLLAALVPFGVARLQKTLTYLVLRGFLYAKQPRWRIAVVERDVPCAHLAMQDLEELLGNLLVLEGAGRSLPTIELRVFRTTEFMNAPLGGAACEFDDEVEPFEADVVLGISLLQRSGFSRLPARLLENLGTPRLRVHLRSAFAPTTQNRVKASSPIRYSLDDETPQPAPLVYFLQNIFRKETFREGQMEVLRQSLRGESVIGLLPTGAGKSLTYQLSTLLQPGLALVVAPLKSLMRDQHDNLIEAGIDTTVFINSSLGPKALDLAMERMKRGHHQFVFISPERLQIQKFRTALQQTEVSVVYCVVDEAHCVSEWGHDFRTAYLRLGPNARAHCRTQWPRLPVIALTGTASFDVLADVRRELELEEEVPTVTPETFERPELGFEIVPVLPPALPEQASAWDIRKAVYEQKKVALAEVLRATPEHFGADSAKEFYSLRDDATCSGLTFTPHANGDFGVRSLASALSALPGLEAVGCFASSDDQLEDEEELLRVQQDFKANRLALLVATKAFGMGIDKPNIRYVVHANMSQSIESYYQEAGRAGRDRKPARCVILYCPQHVSEPCLAGPDELTVDRELLLFFHHRSFKGQEKEKRIVYDLLKGDARPDVGAPDLEALLDTMQPEDPPRLVTIDFANRHLVGDMAAFLSQKVDGRFTERIVSLACSKARGPSDIVRKLNWAFKRSVGSWPRGRLEEYATPLSRWMARLRDEQDTFKAVYRLSLVGVISDYVVDYNRGVIEALIQKRTTAGYVGHLQAYIARYVSRERAQMVPEEVLAHAGENIVQKCLGYLIDFVYAEIETRRRNAIQVMEEAVREGADKGPEAFQDRVNTYFDSRYTPRLQAYLYDYTLDLVWEIMEETKGTDDNIRHLRGACDRLLTSNPSNAAFLLLRAFTRCLRREASLRPFQTDFRNGWELMRRDKKLAWADYIRSLERYHAYVTLYDQEAALLIEDEIAHTHATWLRSFNQQFLKQDGKPDHDTNVLTRDA